MNLSHKFFIPSCLFSKWQCSYFANESVKDFETIKGHQPINSTSIDDCAKDGGIFTDALHHIKCWLIGWLIVLYSPPSS